MSPGCKCFSTQGFIWRTEVSVYIIFKPLMWFTDTGEMKQTRVDVPVLFGETNQWRAKTKSNKTDFSEKHPFLIKVPSIHQSVCICVPSLTLFSVVPWSRSSAQDCQQFSHEYLWNPPNNSAVQFLTILLKFFISRCPILGYYFL